MLQIKNIEKVYKTGSMVQKALNDVSLNLRDNEFVAVLGQSGSGKTTLLNIIGGLDRYNEGDLIIDGVSTKRYSDRDWDSYRNHTVGFVFQSYNLIPHQTVLKNVELALTISGISSKERTSRAKKALEEVGLSEHIQKRPSQLSGGQMQRVAIARALVNDPKILLADEPTGALDSDTSLQVMDLLKEVARDRLVVMVTHNPELADRYATRIVTLKDGEITSDSDPYEPEEDEGEHQNMGRASMSFLTALSLSFNNLLTKKARTILVSFAGSIGIIGIALILALSHGANTYIHNVEEESLQSYPLTITDTNFDLMSMYASTSGMRDDNSDQEELPEGKDVEELRIISGVLSGLKVNDLKSFHSYLESDECDIYDYVQALEYGYNLTPQVYKVEKDGYRQVNPDKSFSSMGFSGSESIMNGMLSTMSSTDSFFALPEDEALCHSNFDLKAGRWPENYNECVVILTRSGKVADMTLYIMGLKDPKELEDLVKAFAEGSVSDVDETPGAYRYEDFIGIEFRLISATDYYSYDKEYHVWTDHSGDKKYMNQLLKNAEPLTIVGVIQPSDGSSTSSTEVGFGYQPELLDHIIEQAKASDIVKQQLKNPEINVFTGKPFDEEKAEGDLDIANLFNVDQDAISEAFNFNTGDFDLSSFDTSGMDFSDIDVSGAMSSDDFSNLMPDLSEDEITDLFSKINIKLTKDDMSKLFTSLLTGYTTYVKDDPRADVSLLPSAFADYLLSERARNILLEDIQNLIEEKGKNAITREDLIALIEHVMSGYSAYLEKMGITEEIEYSHLNEYLNSSMAQELMNEAVDTLSQKISKMTVTSDEVLKISEHLVTDYEKYAEENNLPSASYLLDSFIAYLSTDEASGLITDTITDVVDTTEVEDVISRYTNLMATQIGKIIQQILTTVSDQIVTAIVGNMSALTSSLSDNLLSAFNFDTDALASLFKMNMTSTELKDLMVSLLSNTSSSYETNLKLLGYADKEKPSSITIYPKDFESKQHIKEIIGDYNTRMEKAGEEDKVIEYTDVVDSLMSSVTIIIDVISYILIAFVAISLIVSSIMIGVITYISVLERRKEIGILRAIGASKRNISQVFNAETFIIGTLAGIFGVGISALLTIPINLIIHALSGQDNINAILPPAGAAALVALSIILTLIGGIIPSRKAAKSDPVTALRSE